MCKQLHRFACGHIQKRRLRCKNSSRFIRAMNNVLPNWFCNNVSSNLGRGRGECPGCKRRQDRPEKKRGAHKQPVSSTGVSSAGARPHPANVIGRKYPEQRPATPLRLRETETRTAWASSASPSSELKVFPSTPTANKMAYGPRVVRSPRVTAPFGQHGRSRSEAIPSTKTWTNHTRSPSSSSPRTTSLKDRLRQLYNPSEESFSSDESFVSEEAKKIESQSPPRRYSTQALSNRYSTQTSSSCYSTQSRT